MIHALVHAKIDGFNAEPVYGPALRGGLTCRRTTP
jgi:hypothetical protein